MTVFQAAILGIIQGLTEFLPISSSGHLIFIPKLFDWPDQGLAFDVVLHLGSLLAVLVYFRRKIGQICLSLIGKGEKSQLRLAGLLFLSIIPAGVIGFFFNDFIEAHTRSASVIAWGLIGWGAVLFLADRYSRIHSEKSLEQLSWRQAICIGCAQAIALIPGTSRSGITMTAGLFSKLDKKSAAEFSFLMSIPVIVLAGAVKIVDVAQQGSGVFNFNLLAVGCISAAVSGFIAIAGLMKIIQKWSFTPFVIYRIAVGVLILFLLV